MRTPKELKKFVDEGGTTLHCEDGDWDLNINVLKREAPKGAFVIAENGCGDFLFLKSSNGKLGERVFVYWHEENRLPVRNPLRNNTLFRETQKLFAGKKLLSSRPFRSPLKRTQPVAKLRLAG